MISSRFSLLLLLLPFASSSTVCVKSDIDSRRGTSSGLTGLSISPREFVQCDELDLRITSATQSEHRLLAEGALNLAPKISYATRLTRLRLDGNRVQDAGAEALFSALGAAVQRGKNKGQAMDGTKLEKLELARNNISDSVQASLASAVEDNTKLQHLDLDYNLLSSLSSFFAALPSSAVSSLSLNGNMLGADDDSISSLSSSLSSSFSPVHTLELARNGLDSTHASMLATALETQATTAAISGDQASAGMREMVREIFLDGNEIGDAGMQALAEMLLVNGHVEKLGIRGNDGAASKWGDAVNVLLSLGSDRVSGAGAFDCVLHKSQPFHEYPERPEPETTATLGECQQLCRQMQKPACAGVEYSSETQECWISPYSYAEIEAQVVDADRHYLCDNTRQDYEVLSVTEL